MRQLFSNKKKKHNSSLELSHNFGIFSSIKIIKTGTKNSAAGKNFENKAHLF